MEVSRRRALDRASIPTLLMCLAQITDDDKWLRTPFLPRRDTELFADESGGLPAPVQRQIVSAIEVVLDELESGLRQLPAEPEVERLARMMSVCVGENVGFEYAPMFMEEMGIQGRDVPRPEVGAAGGDLTVLIIGAGLSGVAAAVKLRRLGVPYLIVEKNHDVGGTWLENTYPESGCDTPNHFYSYSFAPNRDWTRYYSKRDELLSYIRGVAENGGVLSQVRFGTEVSALEWDDANSRWTATLDTGHATATVHASVVISAVGQLNRPKTTSIPGVDTFPGPVFHSAAWRHDVDLIGKRIAVIGTGASAIQLLRSVAERAGQVTVFQRSPQWIKPSRDYHRTVSPEMLWCSANIPYYERWYRFQLFWRYGDGLLRTLRRDPSWEHHDRSMNSRNDRHRDQMLDYLEHQLAGRPDLLERCRPDYPPYAKRILVDNDWFATLRRDDVSLVADAVEHIDGPHVVTSTGERHEFDVIILATGFEAGRMLAPMTIRGRTGRELRDVWGDDDPRAYLGIAVPDYPNLFCLYGPNTNVAHGGSVIFQAECQSRYITSCLKAMIEQNITAVEVRREVHDEYNRRVDAEHGELVWTHPGVDTWYRNAAGRVFSPMPWRLVDYWAMTHDADLADFHLSPARLSAAPPRDAPSRA